MSDYNDYDDDVLELDPESANNPHLKHAGWYGQDTDGGGDAEVFKVDWPMAKEPNLSDPPHAQITIKVNHPEFGTCFTRCFPQSLAPNSGSKLKPWLEALGVNYASFRKSELEGMKCAIEVKEPRDNQGVTYSGDIKDIRGV